MKLSGNRERREEGKQDRWELGGGAKEKNGAGIGEAEGENRTEIGKPVGKWDIWTKRRGERGKRNPQKTSI